MKDRRFHYALFVLIGLFATSGVAHAEENDFFGLLRSRDLTPFGFLRLDMRPAHAVAIEPGSWAFEAELGYQNTWSLSSEVEDYLTELDAEGRRDIGPAEVAAIEALPGENYMLDVESANLDLTFHYKISHDWTGYFIASFVSYQGGFLDGTIESFHKTFGFSDFGRPAARKNDVSLIYDLKSAHVVSLGSPTDGGYTDPTIGVRYVGFDLPDPWHLALEAAVKIPVGGERFLLSTGRTDYGLQASVQRREDRHGWYGNVAAVYYAGANIPVPQDSQVVPTLIFGYEYAMTGTTNLNLQAYISESVYTHRQTDLDELLGEKYQVSVGVRHRSNNMLFTFGITENLQNINNTPDIGFQLGFAFVPKRVSTATGAGR